MTIIRAGEYISPGWHSDGFQDIYYAGEGNFFVAGLWYSRPDLVAEMPPPQPTWADRARMEQQRLTTPWVSYGTAWQEAKALKSFSRRWALYGLPFAYGICALIAATVPESQVMGDQATFPLFIPQNWLILAVILSGPFAFWKVYHSAVKRRDSHKAAALVIASYGVVAVASHAAVRHGQRHPSSPV